MNTYIIELVKKDLKNHKGYGIVRDSKDKDSFLIYNSNKTDPHLLRFKDYWFEVCTQENGDLIQHVAFTDLSKAIDFINKENS